MNQLVRLAGAVLLGVVAIGMTGELEPPAQQVISTVQDSVWAVVLAGPSAGRVRLVMDSTRGPPPFGPRDTTGLLVFERFLADVAPELIADFRARNEEREAVDVERLISLGAGPLARIDLPELMAAGENPLTGVLVFDRYPGSTTVFTLSRVGFDPERRQALVHLMSYCGGRCGGTMMLLLRRDETGAWRVEREAQGLIAWTAPLPGVARSR